ncbi:MAG: EamA family transporter [Chloroflexi bacterium]|nr:EamA family transporter [Chloroflexota bacterium]OJV89463.1 MAG: hypothetical protein BGO39_36450 [Chloroflexi bacterium 54-19]
MGQVTQAVGTKKVFDIKVVLAFLAIYFVWGSTFLAIRVAVETFPPFLLVGFRCFGAGLLLYAWVRFKTGERLAWRHWRNAAVGGFCFFVVCQGYLAWAEKVVPSGIAAVVLALIPLWVVVLDWLRPGGQFPGKMVITGIMIGFAGLVLLVGPGLVSSGASVNTLATLFLAVAALGWAFGTLYSRYRATDASSTAMSAMQLLTSGGMLMVISLFTGQWGEIIGKPVQGEVIWSLLYLILIGSVITFSAYVWLLRVVSPTQVATYAYVNPVVALLLGAGFAGEVLTFQDLIGSLVIVAGVVLIITFQRRRNQPSEEVPLE